MIAPFKARNIRLLKERQIEGCQKVFEKKLKNRQSTLTLHDQSWPLGSGLSRLFLDDLKK